MSDGAEPIPVLDPSTRKRLQAEIMRCANRKQLNSLTIRIWRTYEERSSNAAALAQLRTAIEARRAAVDIGNPR
jgi:hypothetical protein